MDRESRQIQWSNYSPLCFGRMLLRNLWMIVAAALICAMGASLYMSWLRAPVYQATMTYAVSSRKTSYTSTGVTASKEVTAVMIELLQTDVITGKIREENEKLANFDGTITATQVGETNLMTVTAQASTPEQAFLALDTLVDLFPELSDYISEHNVAQVIRNPTVSASPVNAIDERGTAMKAALAGAVLMAALLCWINISRETVQTREGARRLLDAPIAAVVSHERKNRTLKAMVRNTNKGLQVFAPTTSFQYTEQINKLCTRLEQESASKGMRYFLVTGVGENEGKSTIAGNVAAMLAMKGKRVALLDGDLRKPAMYKFFDGAYASDLPFNELLARPFTQETFDKCMVRHKKLGLYMLFASKPEKTSMQQLTGETMKRVLRQLEEFEFVIIDTPPMGFFPDAEAMADLVDGTLMVVRQDYTPACDINDAVDMLRSAKSKFLGCVLNDMDASASGGYHTGYGYGYGQEARNSGHKHS